MAELAAIGTVGSIAASGAKLAVLLYSFSTTVAGAKKEVVSVAESISVFCTVLKLLGSTLEKQDSARFWPPAHRIRTQPCEEYRADARWTNRREE
jgi:hypothetical protein